MLQWDACGLELVSRGIMQNREDIQNMTEG